MLGPVKAEAARRSVRLAGIITTADLRAVGRSPEEIRTMVRRRDLVRLARGLYVTAELASSLRRLPVGKKILVGATAVGSLGPSAVVSHHSAAQLHELDLLLPLPARITVTRPPGSRRSSDAPGVLVHSAA
jgi:predicted transcriptional regulator of viral defense system